jgi:hypothetical protein
MNIAYKYLEINKGLIVFFEKEIPFFNNQTDIEFKHEKDGDFLCIGTNHHIPLQSDFLNVLPKADVLFIAVGMKDRYDSKIQGGINLDKLSIGRVMAYSGR